MPQEHNGTRIDASEFVGSLVDIIDKNTAPDRTWAYRGSAFEKFVACADRGRSLSE